MKSSRAMLLAALLFSTPVTMIFAEDTTPVTPVTPASEQVEKIGMMSKLAALFVVAPDFFAEKTLGNIAKLGFIKDTKVASFLNNKYTGRIAFLMTVFGLYKLYTMQTTENIDSNDDAIFGDEEYAN